MKQLKGASPASRSLCETFLAESKGSTAETPPKARTPKNKTRTEKEFEAMLKRENPGCPVLFERYTFKLADDCRYTPDFCVVHCQPYDIKSPEHPWTWLDFWEVKGAHLYKGASASATRTSLTKPKLAAELFPWHAFSVAQKDKLGEWTRKRYYPAAK